MKRLKMMMWLMVLCFSVKTVCANQEIGTLIGPTETKLEKAEPEDYGTIVIPEDIFPGGKGLPIPIYIPPVINNSNAFFGDWKTIKEIAGEKVKFSAEKLLKNLAKLTPSGVPEYPGHDVGVGAAFSIGGAVLLAFEQAFEKNGFKITIQKNPQGDVRAVIEIFTDEGNVLRLNAGGVISSPRRGIAAVGFSRYLEDRFSLPPSNAIYQAFWIIDKKHKRDPYIAYLSLRPKKDALVIVPKIYSGDKFKIARIITPIWGPTVLELKGGEYASAWSYLLSVQEPETLKVLELLPEASTAAADWKEYKLGALSLSVPSDWKILGPKADSFAAFSTEDYTDRRYVIFMVGVARLIDPFEGVESGKVNIDHFGSRGGQIKERGTTSQKISITHIGRLVDSFKTEIAGRPVTVCALRVTEDDRLFVGEIVKGIEVTNWSFVLMEEGKSYGFVLLGVDPAFQSAIFKQLVSRIRFLPR